MSITSIPTSRLITLAGTPCTQPGNSPEPTYARTYTPSGGSQDIRHALSLIGDNEMGEGYQKFGERLAFTEPPGNCHFRTVTTLKTEDQSCFLNCFAYALGTFGSALETLADKKISEIQLTVLRTITPAVEQYFVNTLEPKDGDLAVYSTSHTLFTASGYAVSPGDTHAGIYRKHTEIGGSIESKWGRFGNPFVFEHSPFLVPDFYGDTIRFFRLRA